MLSRKLFQKPRNDLEQYERALKEPDPSVPDEMCLSCPQCRSILFVSELSEQLGAVSYTHLTLPTT